MTRKTRSIEERFWEKVDKSGECWLWTAFITPKGYGRLAISRTKYRYAHHLAWEFAHGGKPEDGLIISHITECPNRHCVNPEHLVATTRKGMTALMIERGNGRDVKYKLTFEQMSAIREMYVTGNYSVQSIAEHFGVTPSYVYKALRGQFDGDPTCAIVKGRGRGTKLTYTEAETIRERYAMGVYTMQQLADIYHVNISTISLIVSGKRMNHPAQIVECS
jgi:DNA-binding MarR family transcriptional regulator